MLYSVCNENDLLWKDRLAVILFIYLFWLLFSQLSTCIWLYYYKRDGSLWRALTLDLQNVSPPAGRFETSRVEVCRGSGTNDKFPPPSLDFASLVLSRVFFFLTGIVPVYFLEWFDWRTLLYNVKTTLRSRRKLWWQLAASLHDWWVVKSYKTRRIQFLLGVFSIFQLFNTGYARDSSKSLCRGFNKSRWLAVYRHM